MSAAQNILEELEAIGVLGGKPASSVKASAQNTKLESKPAPALTSESRLRFQVMEHCERAVDLLERSIEAQMELREVFVALHGLCGGTTEEAVDGSGDEDEEEGDEEEAQESQETVEENLDEGEEPQLPQTDTLVVPLAIPLVSEEPPEELPLLQETHVSNTDTGSAVQDLIAQNDAAYRKDPMVSRGHDVGSEEQIPPPRSLDTALNTVPMPAARRAFFAELKDTAEGKTKKNRVQ